MREIINIIIQKDINDKNCLAGYKDRKEIIEEHCLTLYSECVDKIAERVGKGIDDDCEITKNNYAEIKTSYLESMKQEIILWQ